MLPVQNRACHLLPAIEPFLKETSLHLLEDTLSDYTNESKSYSSGGAPGTGDFLILILSAATPRLSAPRILAVNPETDL